jgi:glycosyltransferase involved in cell wall biosynthesis
MGGDFYKAYSSDKINLLKETYQIDHTFVFLALGRLSKQKNHAMLFQALQRIKDRDFVCLIAGSGPLEEELKALASKYSLNDKVRFIGHTDKIEELLNLSDVLVQASFFEGFPNVFIEAASIGIPIVATNVGSSKTLIKENGILVPPNSVEAFAEALLLMMKNHEKYKTAAVTMSNSDFLKQFHKESMLQNYLSYYRELL